MTNQAELDNMMEIWESNNPNWEIWENNGNNNSIIYTIVYKQKKCDKSIYTPVYRYKKRQFVKYLKQQIELIKIRPGGPIN